MQFAWGWNSRVLIACGTPSSLFTSHFSPLPWSRIPAPDSRPRLCLALVLATAFPGRPGSPGSTECNAKDACMSTARQPRRTTKRPLGRSPDSHSQNTGTGWGLPVQCRLFLAFVSRPSAALGWLSSDSSTCPLPAPRNETAHLGSLTGSLTLSVCPLSRHKQPHVEVAYDQLDNTNHQPSLSPVEAPRDQPCISMCARPMASAPLAPLACVFLFPGTRYVIHHWSSAVCRLRLRLRRRLPTAVT
ncbi:hypothetical protein QBC39DRAFT_53177 [Podospora conica]|nr:hypothetical protein QBC39DRAFT_53177 [Schizothecium conicum]